MCGPQLSREPLASGISTEWRPGLSRHAEPQETSPGERICARRVAAGAQAVDRRVDCAKRTAKKIPRTLGQLSTQHKVELARTLCASEGPINKSQLARALGIACSSLYVQLKRPKMDKALAVRIEHWHEQDETMGHRKRAVLLATGKNRVKRVMRKYGIAAHRTKKKDIYPGKAVQIAPHLLRERKEAEVPEVIFSDIFARAPG
jgi:hypothetical protein